MNNMEDHQMQNVSNEYYVPAVFLIKKYHYQYGELKKAALCEILKRKIIDKRVHYKHTNLALF